MKNKLDIQDKMRLRLSGSKFRWLNEKLYTQKSEESLKYFQNNQNAFYEVNIFVYTEGNFKSFLLYIIYQYHEGFKYQIQSWPLNPIDLIIKKLKDKLKLFKDTKEKKSFQIADMGCGEGKLGIQLKNVCIVHSFDLVSANGDVIVADIANVPLKDEQVQAVVFCLSLMGTNYLDFLNEGVRILSQK